MNSADDTRWERSRPQNALAIVKFPTESKREVFLKHGRPEQGDRFVKEGIQVGRGAQTAAVR